MKVIALPSDPGSPGNIEMAYLIIFAGTLRHTLDILVQCGCALPAKLRYFPALKVMKNHIKTNAITIHGHWGPRRIASVCLQDDGGPS